MTDPSISELERQAEEDRRRLASTLDGLSANLAPRRMVGEVLAYAQGGAVSLVRFLGKAAVANPVRTALAGLGAILLVSGRARRQSAKAVSRLFSLRAKDAIADKRPHTRTIELKAERPAASSRPRIRKAASGPRKSR